MALLTGLSLLVASNAFASNIALGSTVTVNATLPLPPFIYVCDGSSDNSNTYVQAITDGTPLPEMSCFRNGLYWAGADNLIGTVLNAQGQSIPTPVTPDLNIDIDFGGTFLLDHALVQADDNDFYQLQYHDGTGYHDWWTIPAINSFGFVTRSSGTLTPVLADGVRFFGLLGLPDGQTAPDPFVGFDNIFAVSEIQVFTPDPVPEPATLLLLGTGLAGVARWRKKRTH